ncbi:MAG: hypothetical protein PHE32_01950 [Candidatus Shapirobacteria bacterium]|nr:hypothetical protein [Candidatus Shapirobacteria bacterium]MDD4410436.1 hypothetical protein [Candidatus Shapirobacteria bacterium]
MPKSITTERLTVTNIEVNFLASLAREAFMEGIRRTQADQNPNKQVTSSIEKAAN